MKKTCNAAMAALFLAFMADASDTMKIPLNKWKPLQTRIESVSPDILKITYSDRGTWPEARCALPEKGISQYDALLGEIRFTGEVPAQGTAFIFYTAPYRTAKGELVPARRLIANFDQILQLRPVPADRWLTFEWNYKKLRAWATPAHVEPFNFNEVYAIGISCSKRKTFMNLEIRNIRLEKKQNMKNEAEFERFKKNHKPGTLKNKKLVMWAYAKAGRQTNSVADTVAHLSEYKKISGIDGISMDITHASTPGEKSASFRDRIFTEEPWSPAWQAHLDKAVKLVKNADWGHLRHNFFRLDIVGQGTFKNPDGTPKTLDWFDDALWKNILRKVTKFAEAAQKANCNIMFDNESYSTKPYDYAMRYKNTGRSFAEYEKKVRQRGREVAEAFAAGHPHATVIFMFAPWVLDFEKEQDIYGLLPAFLDGMCEADTSLKLIDGYERGYGFTDRESVLRGLFDQCSRGPARSLSPERYRQKMNVGFGIWIQFRGLQPEPFAKMALEALRECKEYVWLYTEKAPLDNAMTRTYLQEISKMRESGR